ncbi:MAG TPA: hypothetical protein VKZ85_08735 [Woeseiaceae bacterium]|nr:hypothetical protein [Woeseiaceae bacterium]
MLSRIILASYKLFLEIAIWIVLLGATILGFKMAGFWVGIAMLLGAFVFCVAVFGGFLLIADIQTSVSEIRNRGTNTAPSPR